MGVNSNSGKPVFIVVEGLMRGQQWVMEGTTLTIGRDSHCDISIPDRRISREHVRIQRHADHFTVEDLSSKNGTHLNGERLEGQHELNEGDEIQMALCVKLRFIGSEATVPLSLEDDDLFEDGQAPAEHSGLVLNENTRQVMIDGTVLEPPLSLHQYRLLKALYDLDGGVCERDEVVRIVWPEDDVEGVSEQAIDALVRRLRDRLAELAPDRQFVITVRGQGFRLARTGE